MSERMSVTFFRTSREAVEFLGRQSYRDPTFFDVGIWRDENTFVFVTENGSVEQISAVFNDVQVSSNNLPNYQQLILNNNLSCFIKPV